MSNKQAKRKRQALRDRLRPGLPKLPVAMEKLDVDERGYPIPWFVYKDPATGVPDFRVVGPGKMEEAIRRGLCWVSGRPFPGRYVAFLGGPLSLLTTTYGEPPSLIAAADFAARACPFLAIPSAKRREAGLVEGVMVKHPAHVEENPGVVAMLVCGGYESFRSGSSILFTPKDWDDIIWYSAGKVLSQEETKDPEGVVAKALSRAEELLVAKIAEEQDPDGLDILQRRLRMVRRHAGLLPSRPRSDSPSNGAVVAAALAIGLGAGIAGRRR